jgi:hypothetical protein
MYEREPYGPRPKEPGVIYTTEPSFWPLTPAMQAVRQQFIETYRDEHTRRSMVRMAKFILEQQEAGARTVTPSALPLLFGAGDVVKHLKDIGVLRKSDSPRGGWYYILTPCARDWAMWTVTSEEKILNGGWPAVDPSAEPVAGKHPAGVGGAAEDRAGDQSQRGLPPVGERPSREGRSDGGDDAVFPCQSH